jgi:predicted enzyme related to lactoylglutathione lyase
MVENAGKASVGFWKLIVSDLDRSTAFYQAVCGYGEGELHKFSIGGRRFKQMILTGEDPADTLWILAFNDGEGVTGSSIIVGLNTSDLNAFQARVTANGGAVVDEIKTIKLGDREVLIGAYSDPDGHLIQAIQG